MDFLEGFSVESKKNTKRIQKNIQRHTEIICKKIEIKIGKWMFYVLAFIEENFSRKQAKRVMLMIA